MNPQKTVLSGSQAERISRLTGIDAPELVGLSLSQIESRCWQIDPDLLAFHRVCGTVVRRDFTTGVEELVRGASVLVEMKTRSLLGLFPAEVPWAWLFPFRSETEAIAETITDARGNFSIQLPRFEIESILRFRRERLGHLELFAEAPGEAPQHLQMLRRELIRLLFTEGSGEALRCGTGARRAGSAHRIQLDDLGLDATALQGLDLARYYGPFLRDYRVVVPEWMPIFDLPDISFRVIQDVDGRGVHQTIHAGGLFEVPWSAAGDIPHLRLQATVRASTRATCSHLRWPNNNSCESLVRE